MRSRRVEGHGGVGLHVVETGPEGARPILLIHGWSQHHLSWSKQLSGPLAERFRLVAPDLRGHGASDKPADAGAYDHGEPWADDVAALIAALGPAAPVLVGWSMGGWIVGDYLARHGAAQVAGVVLTGTRLRAGALADPAMAAQMKPDAKAEGMFSENQQAQLTAAIAFAKACAAGPLSKTDLALMTGFAMLCPPQVRKAARTRPIDHRETFRALAKPALLIHGAADRICGPAFQSEAEAAMPTARVERYAASGHMPFWEEPARFDADLGSFVDGLDAPAI